MSTQPTLPPATATVPGAEEDTVLFIDALRGIAALAVLVTHAVDLGVSEVYGPPLPSNPLLWRTVRALLGHGAFFVWTFFVLSGYCIHQSIVRGMAAGTFTWRKYALARITRIYPLFLIGLALAVLLWQIGVRENGIDRFAWPQLGASLVMLHGITYSFPCYDQSWSLSNEMVYYAVWPLALVLGRGNGIRSAQIALFGTLAAVIAVFVTWNILHRMESSAAVSGVWTLSVLFPVWIAGAWLYASGTRLGAGLSRLAWLSRCIPLCLASMAVLFYVRFQGLGSTRNINVIGLTSIPGLILLVAGGHHLRLSEKPWARPVCRWLGELSYPCYILHYQAVFLVNHWLPMNAVGHPFLRASILFFSALAFTVAVGPPLERRIMRWRKKVLARASEK